MGVGGSDGPGTMGGSCKAVTSWNGRIAHLRSNADQPRLAACERSSLRILGVYGFSASSGNGRRPEQITGGRGSRLSNASEEAKHEEV